MRKIINAVKKATVKKAVVKEVKKEVVCTNCENSGKECRACGFGTQPVL